MAIIKSRTGRPLKTLIVLGLFLAAVLFTLHLGLRPEDVNKFASQYSAVAHASKPGKDVATFDSTAYSFPIPKESKARDFWTSFSKMLISGAPAANETLASLTTIGWVGFEPIQPGQQPDQHLNLPQDQILELLTLHASVVDQILNIVENLPFNKGTRGIVTTAGWSAEAILTTSLRMLRMSGSRLPVQIWFFDASEYNEYMCKNVYPDLNAECLLMSDYLSPASLPGGEYLLEVSHHFQMKILSILFSTFEHVLFMDCDLFPASNPDDVFLTEPFISHNFVLWPDYWARTNAKEYYTIVGREAVDMYRRASTESGAMLINKVTHAKALLLAAYYNRYGPNHYYWLFSQGAIGHGDKDTYLPAIEFFDLPFYQVDRAPRRFGYRCNGNERALASAQAHPLDDWIITSKSENPISRGHGGLLSDAPEPRILFVHGNLPKYDSPSLLNWFIEESWEDQQRCDHGKGPAHRLWGPKEFTVLKFGFDLEKVLWDQLRWFACVHGPHIDRWVNGVTKDNHFYEPQGDVCGQAERWYAELLPHETYDANIPSPDSVPVQTWGSLAAFS